MPYNQKPIEENGSSRIRNIVVFLYVTAYLFMCAAFWVYCVCCFIYSVFIEWQGWLEMVYMIGIMFFLPLGSFFLFFLFVVLLNRLGLPTSFTFSRLHIDLTLPEQEDEEDEQVCPHSGAAGPGSF